MVVHNYLFSVNKVPYFHTLQTVHLTLGIPSHISSPQVG